MKKFIIRIFILLVSSYLVSLIIDIPVSKIAQPRGEYSSWKDLYSNNINADLLIFGSSRAMNQFNSQIIEDSLHLSAYNMGLSSARIEISLLRLLEHLRICTQKPKYVTLEIDWLTIDNAKFLYTPWQIFPYMLYNENMYKYTHHFQGYYSHFYIIPLARYGKYGMDIFRNRYRTYARNSNVEGKGFVAFKAHWNGNTNTSEFNVSIHPEEIKYLNEFVEVCKSNQIKLNFVYAPEYIAATKIVKHRDVVINYIHNFADEHSIPFINFSEEDFCSDTTFFYNNRHLNHRGADMFTSEYYVPWIKDIYKL